MRTLLALLLALPTAAYAAPGDEHWVATSTTAMGITGDIVLSPSSLAMARGVTLPLRVAADVPAFQTGVGAKAARILAVTRPANPAVLNGNRLCDAPVTWVVVWRMPRAGLGLAMFSGDRQPSGEQAGGLCGDYFYERVH